MFSDHPIHPPKFDNDPWDCEFLDDCGYQLNMVDGVYQVFESEEDFKNNRRIEYEYPDLNMFVTDMHLMCALIADGPLKSFCYRRLSYLSAKFQLHVLLNELRELAAQKAVAHRDFYNVRKVRFLLELRLLKIFDPNSSFQVDTHIHASSSMNQKHLLRFIKKALKTEADTAVCLDWHKKPMTLKQVFQSMNLTAYELTVDMLDVHAVSLASKIRPFLSAVRQSLSKNHTNNAWSFRNIHRVFPKKKSPKTLSI